MHFIITANRNSENASIFNKVQQRAQRLLAQYGETLDYMKDQLATLLQKYTFVQLSRKLGFKLAYQGRKAEEMKQKGADFKEFRRLVTETVNYCCESSGVPEHTVVTAVAKALRVRVSLVTYWLRDN